MYGVAPRLLFLILTIIIFILFLCVCVFLFHQLLLPLPSPDMSRHFTVINEFKSSTGLNEGLEYYH